MNAPTQKILVSTISPEFIYFDFILQRDAATTDNVQYSSLKDKAPLALKHKANLIAFATNVMFVSEQNRSHMDLCAGSWRRALMTTTPDGPISDITSL